MGGSSAPAAPDYGPLAKANKYAADLAFKSSQRHMNMLTQQFDVLRPMYEAQMGLQQRLGDSQIESLAQQRKLLDENAQRSKEGYDSFNETIDRTNPQEWQEIGNAALARLGEGLENGTYVQDKFDFDFDTLKDSAGYSFRKREGEKATSRALAAQGITGGATAKALTRYGQNFASNEYDRAFARSAQTYGIEAKRRNTLYLQDTAQSQGSQAHLMGIAGMHANVARGSDPTAGYGANAAGYGGAGQGQSAALGALGNLYSGYAANSGSSDRYGAENMGQGAIGSANAGIMQQQANIDRWKARNQNLMGWMNAGANFAAAV